MEEEEEGGQEVGSVSVIDSHPILLRLGRSVASDSVPSWPIEINEDKDTSTC